jgi:hypothetical protein
MRFWLLGAIATVGLLAAATPSLACKCARGADGEDPRDSPGWVDATRDTPTIVHATVKRYLYLPARAF